MKIEQAVRTHALAHPPLAALIGERLYYGFLPENVKLPAATFFLVSSGRDHVTDLRSPRFQFTAWADSYATAADVEEQIEDAFIRYKGMMAGEVPVCQGVIIAPGYDLAPETAPDGKGKRYGRACDIQIIYRGK